MATISNFGIPIKPWYGTHWVSGILLPLVRYYVEPTFCGLPINVNDYIINCCADLYNSEIEDRKNYPDFTGKKGKYFVLWLRDRDNYLNNFIYYLEFIRGKTYDMDISFFHSKKEEKIPYKRFLIKNCRTEWYDLHRHLNDVPDAYVIFEYDDFEELSMNEEDYWKIFHEKQLDEC